MTYQATQSAVDAEIVQHQLLVNGLEVDADIGVFSHEIGTRQKLLLDVTLDTVPPAADVLADTIDYGLVVSYALALAEERNALIETFARRLAALCLGHQQVLGVTVRIGKPAALPGALAGTRIHMRRPA